MAASSKSRPKPKPKAAARKTAGTRVPAAQGKTRSKASTRARPPARAKRSRLATRPSLALPTPVLEPHHVDILALALVAAGIFLGGVAYLHWAGGALGDGAVRGSRFIFGALGYAVPAGLVAAGGLILARELRPPARPLRAGLICLMAALTLALAAGTLGIGPGPASAHAFWRSTSFESRGGIVGQAELYAASHLFSQLGADILAVFLLVAGIILVTGAGFAGVVRVTGSGMLGTGRALRRSGEDLAATLARRPATAAARRSVPDSVVDPLLGPEPDTAELIVRATHVEAPPIDGPAPEEVPEEPLEVSLDDGPILPPEDEQLAFDAPEEPEDEPPVIRPTPPS